MEKWRETLSLGPFSSSFVKQQQPFLPKEKNKTSSRLSKLLVFILQGEREALRLGLFTPRLSRISVISSLGAFASSSCFYFRFRYIYISYFFLSFFFPTSSRFILSLLRVWYVASLSLSLLIFYLSVTETLKAGEELNLICRFLFFLLLLLNCVCLPSWGICHCLIETVPSLSARVCVSLL